MKQRPGVIDLDEVVFDFVGPFIEFVNKKYGTNYTRASMRSYSFERSGIIPKGTNEENVLEFCRQGSLLTLPTMPHAREAVWSLQPDREIVYLTTRHKEFEDDTNQALIDLGIWSPVYFATPDKPKSVWIRELKARSLVDDNPDNINDVRNNTEAHTILYTNIQASIDACKPHDIAHTWEEVHVCLTSRFRFTNKKGPG